MNQELKTYIQNKRQQGIGDDQISSNLIANGWPAEQIQAHLRADLDDVVPLPPAPAAAISPAHDIKPEYGSYGIEYMIMMLALWIAAVSLGSLLHSFAGSLFSGGDAYDEVYGFFNMAATAGLVVTLPVYTFLFFRLHKLELGAPELRRNGLRKFSIYSALVIAFLTGVSHIVWSLFAVMSGGLIGDDFNLGTELLHITITLSIAGTIFAYYLHDVKSDSKR